MTWWLLHCEDAFGVCPNWESVRQLSMDSGLIISQSGVLGYSRILEKEFELDDSFKCFFEHTCFEASKLAFCRGWSLSTWFFHSSGSLSDMAGAKGFLILFVKQIAPDFFSFVLFRKMIVFVRRVMFDSWPSWLGQCRQQKTQSWLWNELEYLTNFNQSDRKHFTSWTR